MTDLSNIAIAFDLDDTLYKERDYVKSGYRAVAESIARNHDTSADDLLSYMVSSSDPFDALLQMFGSEYSISDFLEIYRSHVPVLSMSTDTRELLKSLKESGCQLGIITDGRSISQRNKIIALGLDYYIPQDNIFISEEIGSDKTTPNPFELFKLKVKASSYYYIGDNPLKDFFWPNKLGWTSLMLRDTENLNIHPQSFAGQDKAYKPKFIIENIKQLCQLL